jgi:hypothetical protein
MATGKLAHSKLTNSICYNNIYEHIAKNKNAIVASCWTYLLLQSMMLGTTNIKLKKGYVAGWSALT